MKIEIPVRRCSHLMSLILNLKHVICQGQGGILLGKGSRFAEQILDPRV